jgi:hypothetical protein
MTINAARKFHLRSEDILKHGQDFVERMKEVCDGEAGFVDERVFVVVRFPDLVKGYEGVRRAYEMLEEIAGFRG